MKDGKPIYSYNWLGLKRYDVKAQTPLAPGKATVRFEFAYDGDGAGKGGVGSIFVNGQKVVEDRIDQTQCCMFSLDEAADVGRNQGTPVTRLARFSRRTRSDAPRSGSDVSSRSIVNLPMTPLNANGTLKFSVLPILGNVTDKALAAEANPKMAVGKRPKRSAFHGYLSNVRTKKRLVIFWSV